MTALLDETMDWWLRLRHGGQLLDRAHLDALPAPRPLPWNLSDSLRAAVIALPDEGAATGDPLTALMNLMLEDVTGIKVGWLKGAQVGADYGETLLDGTRWKPRRVWKGPHGGSLHVFTTKVRQVGLHKGRRPVAQITEYLRRRRAPLGLLTNGRQWRLIFADADTQAWAEWDTSEFFSGGRISDSVVGFAHLLGWDALVQKEGAARSPLLEAIADTRAGQAKLSSELGERVRKAVEALLVSRRPVLEETWEELDPQAVYVAACHFVMRLVVTLFAEARGMLPQENPVYHNAYGITGLLESLDRVSPLRLRGRHSGWSRLIALFSLLYKGSPHPSLTLPAYGGDLFRWGSADGDDVQKALHVLESTASPPDDEVIHNILVMLTRTTVRVRDGRSWRRVSEAVNFTDLSSEYIGILYEGLLDYELHKAGEDAVLFLNLGDQPALPISRLEAMDDKAIKALVEKVKGSEGLVIADDDEDAPGEEELSAVATEETDTAQDDSTEADDQREAELQRAMTWARRAVTVGKLVKKAKKGTSKEEQQQRAADALIADLKLPGELYLVRWGGTRKGAGTFYTRPQLTMPTVRRTLEPLTHEDGKAKTPEEILKLKVVDPAMGSGSFLVAALRVLTKAIIEGAYTHGRVRSEGNRTQVEIPILAETDRVFPFAADDPRFAEDFEDTIKRYVVEHCLYGVDIDPLAVELARVAMWVETLDDKLPFTFLDHKLKAGNSLVGCWMDRFRDYPALAWVRESPDKTHKEVHHAKNTWHKALAAKKKAAIDELKAVIGGQIPMKYAGGDDTTVHEDVKRIRRLFGELRRVPADEPARRAKLYRTRIQTDPALKRLKTAFDTWCALWFWPLDQLDSAPMPRNLLAPGEETRAVAREVSQQQRFFHWELEFPDVFHTQGDGFDAVVGNPPWETLQPESKEFFSNLDPLYRTYGKQVGLKAQELLFEENPKTERDWLAYQGAFKNLSNWFENTGRPFGDAAVTGLPGPSISFGKRLNVTLHQRWANKRSRQSGFSDPRHPFLHQGRGKASTYKLFLEFTCTLLKDGGEFGIVLPAGVYSDLGSSHLRALLLGQFRWRWLYSFWNQAQLFPIDSTFRYCIVIAGKGEKTDVVRVAFFVGDVALWQELNPPALLLEAKDIKAMSPNHGIILNIDDGRDLSVLRKMYASSVHLGHRQQEGWDIGFSQGDFNMTSDSKLFPPRETWEERGYRQTEHGRWIGPAGDTAVPLYEGRMIAQFDPSNKAWISGRGRAAEWRFIPYDFKRLEPQYLIGAAEIQAKHRNLRVGFMGISRPTVKRTMVASPLSQYPCGNAVPVLDAGDPIRNLCLAGILNSFCFDFVVKKRCSGLNLNFFVIEEAPLPTFANLEIILPIFPSFVARLSLIGTWFAKDWLSLRSMESVGHYKKNWAVTKASRIRLRCILDVLTAYSFGIDATDFSWILRECDHPIASSTSRSFTRTLDPKGFWRVDKDKHPELRHTVLSLVAFHDLQAMIETHGGDRDAGIQAFCDQNDGEGWMLPETLRLADYGLGHDDRAKEHQPVASALGPRFLDWQLAQTPEESWAECERHARALASSEVAYPPPPEPKPSASPPPATPQPQMKLGFGEGDR